MKVPQKIHIQILSATQSMLKSMGIPLHGKEQDNLYQVIKSFYHRGHFDRGLQDKKKKNAKKKLKKKAELKNNSILHFLKEATIDQGYHANELKDE